MDIFHLFKIEDFQKFKDLVNYHVLEFIDLAIALDRSIGKNKHTTSSII